ncbi:CHAT domain-containing tetratricopeptide repeat protein [Spirulina sp. CCNP1310]|nr:CHAT domain-containing tetratricopeptide repeat protein [Spirulina sp. CCNP1310]
MLARLDRCHFPNKGYNRKEQLAEMIMKNWERWGASLLGALLLTGQGGGLGFGEDIQGIEGIENIEGLENIQILDPPQPQATPTTQDVNEQTAAVYRMVIEMFPAQRTAAGNDGMLLGRAWLSYGIALQYFGRFDEARPAFEQALALLRQNQDVTEATALQQLAAIYAQAGDVYGLTFLEGELRGNLSTQSRRMVLYALGLGYLSLGDGGKFDRGIGLMKEYMRLLPVDSPVYERTAAAGILAALQVYGDPPGAIATLRAALPATTMTDLDLTAWIAIVNQLGRYLQRQERHGEAIALLEEGLKRLDAYPNPNTYIVESNRWTMLALLADLHSDQRNFAQARAIQQQRLTLAQSFTPKVRLQVATTLDELAQLAFWQGDLQGAIAYQQQAYAQFGMSTNPTTWKQADVGNLVSAGFRLQHLGFLQAQAKQWAAAETSLRDGLAMDSYGRRILLENTNLYATTRDEVTIGSYSPSVDAYRTLQGVLMAQNRPDDALVAAEAGRSRALLQLLLNRQAGTNRYIDLEPPTVAEIQAIARREQTTLVQYSLLYDAPFSYRTPQPGEPPAGTPTQLLIWVITPSGEIHHRTLALEEDLGLLVERTRNRLLSRRGRTADEQLQQLHQLLIAPIASLLPRDPAARVTFIPQDMLFFIPFPALQDAQGVALIDRHTILTAPSIQVLSIARQVRGQLNPRTGAAIIGNPTMPLLPGGEAAYRDGQSPVGDHRLAPLPGAELEAQAIAQLFQTTPLIGDAATEPAAIAAMNNARIIHLATHGLLEPELSYSSSLAFAPTQNSDGFLTLREINSLELNAELAILSACDTGRGWIGTGDGVIGLSRSFIGAGAASVVVSLWAIPDQPTATLMTEFYRQFNGGMDGAQALRQAMLLTRDRYGDPGAWAAFTITGAVD